MFNSKNVKSIFVLILVFVMALSSINGVYARKTDNLIPIFDFVNGMDENIQSIKYYNKDFSVRGKALEGTRLTISTYWYNPDNERTIVYKNKSTSINSDSGEWVLQKTQSCTVGISGIFGVSVIFKPGNNRITVESDSGTSYEMEVEYVKNEEIVEKINTIFFKNLDLELIN